HGLLTTIAWQLSGEPVQYALEGAVFIAGAAVQWLRDEMQFIARSEDVESLAARVEDAGGVKVVPAFTGLGAPRWDPEARGAVLGLTRGSNRAHIARATLEGIAHQVADVVEAMTSDAGQALEGLRVDGGAAANDLLMQLQADYLGAEVRRPTNLETTASGAAFLAGLAVGYFSSKDDISRRWQEDRRFEPTMDEAARMAERASWAKAVARLRTDRP
ncbi:MAG: glycerol kinase, partial [Myxococcota bacterium]